MPKKSLLSALQYPTTRHTHAQVKWKNPLIVVWHGPDQVLCFCFFFFLIGYLFHLYFQCYPKSPLHAPPPTPLPTHFHFLALAFPCTGAYKVCNTKGPLFPVMADQAIFCYICSQRHELWGYWLVHIVVPPIGLQTPSAPWVLSLAPPLGALCSILQMTVSIHFCICQALAKPHRRQLYQGPFSKILLAYAIVSGFGG